MKKLIVSLIVACTIMLVAAPVKAADTEQCKLIESVARDIMYFRQAGISLKETLEVYIDEGELPSDNIMLLIEVSYAERVNVSQNFKEQAINNFADKVFLQCIRN